MKTDRTLHDLRNKLQGRIYIYLKDAETEKQFAEAAEKEGYRFGSIAPTQAAPDDLIALKDNDLLAHVGFVGRIAFQCNGGSNAKGTFHRIDYAKYAAGEKSFIIKAKKDGDVASRPRNEK